MTIQELFIINLKNYRKIRKFSQNTLAERCDSSQTYIAEIEIGKRFPSPGMIERIATALDIESYCLFKYQPEENSEEAGAIPQLSATQKQEITGKIHAAVSRIISQY